MPTHWLYDYRGLLLICLATAFLFATQETKRLLSNNCSAVTSSLRRLSPSAAYKTATMATASMACLPTEVILRVMECLPDIANLQNLVLANKRFHGIFDKHKNGKVLPSVLKNELGKSVFLHAIVAHQVEKDQVRLPDFTELSMDGIVEGVARLQEIRNQASILRLKSPGRSSIMITLPDAARISFLWKRIAALTEEFVNDCSRPRVFGHLSNSVKQRQVSPSERRRIYNSMYLFHTLCIFCRNLFLDIHADGHHQVNRAKLDSCMSRIQRLQSSLTSEFMAPWEMHQVVSLQTWFRRQMLLFGYNTYLTERLTPYILCQGVDAMYRGICVKDQSTPIRTESQRTPIGAGDQRTQVETLLCSRLRPFVTGMEVEAIRHPPHGFGMILSRGQKDNWTRKKKPKDFDEYRSFGCFPDKDAYINWAYLENPSIYPSWVNVPDAWQDEWLQEKESMLDAWYASFWDPIRIPEINESIYPEIRPRAWVFLVEVWDHYLKGYESALILGLIGGPVPEREKTTGIWERLASVDWKELALGALEYLASIFVIPFAILLVLVIEKRW